MGLYLCPTNDEFGPMGLRNWMSHSYHCACLLKGKFFYKTISWDLCLNGTCETYILSRHKTHETISYNTYSKTSISPYLVQIWAPYSKSRKHKCSNFSHMLISNTYQYRKLREKSYMHVLGFVFFFDGILYKKLK